MKIHPQSYFVTGTDTNVGKTRVASALIRYFVAQGFRTVGMKPVAAGCEMVNNLMVNEDVTQLMQAGNVQAPTSLVNPYCFLPAIAPHIAAHQADNTINLTHIQQAFTQLNTQASVVIVEGAGGFCVPLNAVETSADLAVKLNLPVILVVGVKLGCINHALLTVQAIESRGLILAGWVASQVEPNMLMAEENIQALQQRIEAPLLVKIPFTPDENSYLSLD